MLQSQTVAEIYRLSGTASFSVCLPIGLSRSKTAANDSAFPAAQATDAAGVDCTVPLEVASASLETWRPVLPILRMLFRTIAKVRRTGAHRLKQP